MRLQKLQVLIFIFILNSPLLGNQQKTIKDDLGLPYVLSSPPQRIVSLAPNITEILFALDLGEKVIGVTRFCDFPRKALEKEKIGGMVDPHLERIKAMNPDLIIGFRGNPLQILERLRKLKLPVFVLDMGTDIESMFRLILRIGLITGTEKRAESLVQSLKIKYGEIRSALQCVKHEPKVFLSLHGLGLWTCGRESYLNDLLKKARGVNVAGTIPKRWLHLNREQLLHENPEVIIILSKSEEDFLEAKTRMKNQGYLRGVRAIASESMYFLDENQATRPGPRLISALSALARILHPECFESMQ